MPRKMMFVYILTSKKRTVLYTGVTNDLKRRMLEHRHPVGRAFSRQYNVNLLVYFEAIFDFPMVAIRREKQIKSGSRLAKIRLVESMNPEWRDLFDEL